MDGSSSDKPTVAEAYLSALSKHGVHVVFANGGTDFAPIVEGLLRAGERGSALPRFVTVPHENVAVSMASGFYKVSGTPAAVMVHTTVGTANALCGIMNADRGNVPMLLAAGRSPWTEHGHPGSRNLGIHWSQENFDQAAMLRQYTRWDYELRSGQPVNTVVGRALDIAMSEPKGPVYLTLPREVLGDAAVDPGPEPRERALGAVPPMPSSEAIVQAAQLIAKAERPLIIGGAAECFFDLAALAEDHVIACAPGLGAYLPSSHALNFGSVSEALLAWADLIVVLESPVPWIPRFARPRPETKLIHIGLDPHFSRYPYRGFEMDMAIAGSVAHAVPMLNEALKAEGRRNGQASDRRRGELAEMHAVVRERRRKVLERAKTTRPISPAWIAHCLNQVKQKDAIISNELGVPAPFVDIEEPGCWLATGGSAGGLGHGIGEAIGAKLAAPQRQVVSLVGDGSYMFNVPSACHFVERTEELPTLTIISNNAQWYAVRNAAEVMYPGGRVARANSVPVVDLSSSLAYEKLVEFAGGYGERVDDPAQLIGAMERGLRAVADGNPAVLNVAVAAGGRAAD
ncbi:MAG TPA: thiamine pyrophosphate-requiring protein [Stellaceae bacterium]|jgi:acetolactate synthase-1/2/3 large subunit